MAKESLIIRKQLALFLIVIHLILLGANVLTFGYFSYAFSWSPILTWTCIFAMILLASSYMWIDKVVPTRVKSTASWISAVALGATSIGVGFGLLGFASLWWPILPKKMGLIIAASWLGFSLFSIVQARRHSKFTHLNIDLNLNTPLHLVHITDLHLNRYTSLKKIEKMVSAINQLTPDVIVFTGDLLDIPAQDLDKEIQALSQLKAAHAKLAISGNHDFYTGDFGFPETLEKMGFHYLDNQSLTLDAVSFIGLPDKDGSRHQIRRKEMSELITPLPQGTPIILLDHRPNAFKQSADAGIALQLSGHTHWGQIPPWGILVRLRYAFGVGLGRYKQASIYTSKGTSVWGPPMRLFGRSEIVSLHLS